MKKNSFVEDLVIIGVLILLLVYVFLPQGEQDETLKIDKFGQEFRSALFELCEQQQIYIRPKINIISEVEKEGRRVVRQRVAIYFDNNSHDIIWDKDLQKLNRFQIKSAAVSAAKRVLDYTQQRKRFNV